MPLSKTIDPLRPAAYPPVISDHPATPAKTKLRHTLLPVHRDFQAVKRGWRTRPALSLLKIILVIATGKPLSLVVGERGRCRCCWRLYLLCEKEAVVIFDEDCNRWRERTLLSLLLGDCAPCHRCSGPLSLVAAGGCTRCTSGRPLLLLLKVVLFG